MPLTSINLGRINIAKVTKTNERLIEIIADTCPLPIDVKYPYINTLSPIIKNPNENSLIPEVAIS